jgi:hypothetical protein
MAKYNLFSLLTNYDRLARIVFRIKATVFYRKNTLKQKGKGSRPAVVNIRKRTDNKVGRYSDRAGENEGNLRHPSPAYGPNPSHKFNKLLSHNKYRLRE